MNDHTQQKYFPTILKHSYLDFTKMVRPNPLINASKISKMIKCLLPIPTDSVKRAILLIVITLNASSTAKSQSPIQDISLEGIQGGTVTLSRDPSVQFHVICFLGTECPMARSYGPKLQRFSESYREQGVEFIGVMSNIQDSLEEARDYANDLNLTFPIGKDRDFAVADSLGATRTPEVFVVDRAGQTRYQGRIDNQYSPGITRSKTTSNDLTDAIDALLLGEIPENTVTEAVGCIIGRGSQKPVDFSVTYCKQISRVLQRNCVECHRAGEIGPFSLEEYEEVVGWGETCLEVVELGRMPPWHANTQHLVFANQRNMPPRDKELLKQWVEAGMPFGDTEDLPARMARTNGWRLPREPDLVLPMSNRDIDIPAEGTVEYQYFVVDPKFSEDQWITAAQVQPGNTAVVHHCIVFVRPPDGSSINQNGFLSAYVPGQIHSPLPQGYAQRIPAGSRLVFQMHYTTNGKPQRDRTQIGMIFAKPESVTHEVMTVGGFEQGFEIPPGAPNHSVESRIPWFPTDGHLLSITPHMHLRGKAFRFSAIGQNKTRTLLEVPNYDFNWQHNYELAEPLPLSDFDSLQFISTFDNSDQNPYNPDPKATVWWGDQTWEEMSVVFLSIAKPLQRSRTLDDSKPEPIDARQSVSQNSTRLNGSNNENPPNHFTQADRNLRSKRFASNYMKRFDQNQDGVLDSNELPQGTRLYLFNRMDRNRNKRIEKDEVIQEAMKRNKIPEQWLQE
ncbi:redoxin domain-containing protein [bacterium]|nr:redoxin domain-containing protein [bacterium]MDC0278685.1 redoxin domain-containing protein [bacterium]